MRRLAVAASVLLCLASFATFAQAAAPTCATGVKGAPPTASITFTAPTTNADGSPIVAASESLTYNLYQGTASGAEVKVASGLVGSPIAVSTGITSSNTYYWYVTVSNSGGESAPSNEGCKMFPTSPPGTVTITIAFAGSDLSTQNLF